MVSSRAGVGVNKGRASWVANTCDIPSTLQDPQTLQKRSVYNQERWLQPWIWGQEEAVAFAVQSSTFAILVKPGGPIFRTTWLSRNMVKLWVSWMLYQICNYRKYCPTLRLQIARSASSSYTFSQCKDLFSILGALA